MSLNNNMNNLIHYLKDKNLGRQERLFRLVLVLGISGLSLSIISGMFIGTSIDNVIAGVIGLIAFVVLGYFSVTRNKIQLGASIICAIMIFLVLPLNFLICDGTDGGSQIWFLAVMVFVCLVVEGKTKYVLLVCDFLLLCVCYYIELCYPDLISHGDSEVVFMDSFYSYIIISIMICGMILYQSYIYHSENETAKKQKKEIEELNKMQNHFFSSMSHEIRTPINAIIGLNEMILREDVSDEVAADAINIQGASKMLLSLINDILDMSKIESGKMNIVPVVYDVGDMLSDIVNMIWIRAKDKGLEFHVDVDKTMPAQLYGDEVRIKQILINVLNNAVKYTSEGSVTLSIECKKVENGEVQIIYSVSDTGIGIKKESIPHLFSVFKRVDEQNNRYIEGTGLGLSIVKQLVELMHGEITVNSVYTKGSTFVITIPQKISSENEIGDINLEERHSMNQRSHYKQSFEAPEAHVLIVDDNDTNLMVAAKLLRDTKVKIDTASSGQECLRKTLQNRYNVIFMDHLMPGMDGIECLHAIRNQTGGLNADVPIVALTANAGSENQELYRREGFDGYLLKPVSGVQLEREVLTHLPKELVSMTNLDNFEVKVESPVLGHNRKMSVMICTDSVCDLPKSMLEKAQVEEMPYRVHTEGGYFMDGIEAETDGILSYISTEGRKASSESPTVAEYEGFFANQLTKAQYIIHITMANKVSKGYANALEASKTFENVRVVDSGHLSCGMGFVVLRAAEYAASGMSVDDIVKKIESIKSYVKTSFILDSTEYLARSGRLSSWINKICKTLLLHPVLILKNSSMTVGQIKIGTRNNTWKQYINSTVRDMRKANRGLLFIAYAGLTKDELTAIEEEIRKKVPFRTIVYQKASPAISINCGPGTFGLIYMLDK